MASAEVSAKADRYFEEQCRRLGPIDRSTPAREPAIKPVRKRVARPPRGDLTF